MRRHTTYQTIVSNGMRLLLVLLLVMMGSQLRAQIIINGNVYGGGNEGKVNGNTTVTLRAGDLNKVFAGSRMADITGRTFMNIDGAHASDYILANHVYGGNDISGTIGSVAATKDFESVANILTHEQDDLTPNDDKDVHIDASWDAFVRISNGSKKIYIGQLFGGGNGDYDYTGDLAGKVAPDLKKAYLEICGGSIVYAFGGGNNATVTEKTVICVDNPSEVVNSIKDTTNPHAKLDVEPTDPTYGELLTDARINEMGYNPGYTYPTSDAFQIGSFFGGNNKAAMAIRPMWNLLDGKIRNLYSGGNAGDMTSPEGLLLEIPENSELVVDNVYGGCRKADVVPGGKNNVQQVQNIAGYYFPDDLSARTLVRGGHINNVYGGNDISGKVYGGNAVGVYTSIQGDIFGGGNGSYPYTDNATLKDDPTYGDLYYGDPANPFATGAQSVEALNAFRPNAEQVSIRLAGKADKKTIIHGSVYLGGNSATLSTTKSNPMIELKIGSYVIAENVFLGNNGAKMVEYHEKNVEAGLMQEGVLRTYQRLLEELPGNNYEDNLSRFSGIKLSKPELFAKYMEGCAMTLKPSIVFDDVQAHNDKENYIPYSSYIGSFYCGGNVGSMIMPGTTTIGFTHPVVIYNKLVGGCNNAHVPEHTVNGVTYNADYVGGVIGTSTELDENGLFTATDKTTIKDRLILNLSNLKIQPMRLPIEGVDDETKDLVWNTIKVTDGNPVAWNNNTWADGSDASEKALNSTLNRRFEGGNIYGGCCTSGIVNGNVVINIDATLVDRIGEHGVFDVVATDDVTGEDKDYGVNYTSIVPVSGVILGQQGMDVLGSALNVFGGGKGKDTEIWGSATVNLKRGYTFQIFGGSEEGAIGKKSAGGKYDYYDPRFSTYVNLIGPDNKPGVPKSQDMSDELAEAEFLYGGGFVGPILGDTHIKLENGRVFNSFAGSCNADIQGHSETIIGSVGFPYVRDHLYGGNDLGGKILGTANFSSRIRNDGVRSKVYNTDMLNASAYVEYNQGRVENIFGGCYGVYDYTDSEYSDYFDSDGFAKAGYSKPFLSHAFVNFRPNNNSLNSVDKIFGAGQGYFGEAEENKLQGSSYILIDVPQTMQNYQGTEVFGGGERGGVGMYVDLSGEDADDTTDDLSPDKASAIIDLVSGQFKAVYGGSYQEGITRRTVVNVPVGSTFRANSIFGGAYGLIENNVPRIDVACDVYEANVNFRSENAIIEKAIYGGNNACRRTLYGTVNIYKPVYNGSVDPKTQAKYNATIYGAGYGVNTWSQYTEVNLFDGAVVDQVYGGGENGQVLNTESVAKWKTTQTDLYTDLEGGYTDTGLGNALAKSTRLHEVDATRPAKYNTNVHIHKGAKVGRYCYGGGLGDGNIRYSGNVYGTTYIDLLGGTVGKDLYAAGTTGAVKDSLGVKGGFVASSTAYIEGGTVRNVYGGGWKGSVGQHDGVVKTKNGKQYMDYLSSPTTNDIPGETHVIIGILEDKLATAPAGDKDYYFYHGIPAVERNAYGGGEGGAVFGTSHITLNNGYVGYSYSSTATDDDKTTDINEKYQEKVDDETSDDRNTLYKSGSIYGGGYVDNSSVDVTNVTMYGGHVRNSLFGGGEVAAIGRGVITASGVDNSIRTLEGIYKAGKTTVTLYDGHVHRNVFGGGRGYDWEGNGGKAELYSDGFVFGQTEVNIFGGEVGTVLELELGNGNVYAGGDIGYVYSAYENNNGLCVGLKLGERYDENNGGKEGYYYKKEGGSYVNGVYTGGNWVVENGEYELTEDCKVLVEPHCKVLSEVEIGETTYQPGQYVPTSALNLLKNKNDDATRWACLDVSGIIIHNAVFAGGNTASGSTRAYANATSVFGNATASINDVYHRDLITVGTGHTGGLYGDGNLTFVDGYRGLNITNYGTDYYTIGSNTEITIAEYHALDPREAAYYELRYKCKVNCTDKDGTNYYAQSEEHPKASTLNADDILTLFVKDNGDIIQAGGKNVIITDPKLGKVPNPEIWEENGVCTIYAGRLMNTIQRADFCGVFGSRMVLQGAQDRVPEIVDYTNYTINRVREVSLNQQHSKIASDLALKTGATPAASVADQNPEDFADMKKAVHGNYFGIYNIVNYLGGLSSDVRFDDPRITDNTDEDTYKCPIEIDGHTYNYGTNNATYYNWKRANINHRKRNNGSSLNKVALASGVYLELTTEKSTGNELHEKDWGFITGVVELDLINVQTGIGGGFVYAKNEHRTWTYNKKHHATLTALNQDAVTRKDYDYTTTLVEWETSGNFVHSTQTIIDDCYNISGKYAGSDAVPAHYWYIQGQVYVYDQYISAYTGAPNAYSETVDIPLTITAASHGTMKLLDIQPNRYAYWKSNGVALQDDQKLIINEVEYHLNDPISYWDWHLLSPSEQNLFVEDTYVVKEDCWIGSTEYKAGKVLLKSQYQTIRGTGETPPAVYQKKEVDGVITNVSVDFDFVFRSSNNLGHDTGYILTYKVNNPTEWDVWYTEKKDAEHNTEVAREKNQTGGDGYEDGPTYRLTNGTAQVLGQREYKKTNLIPADVYNTYQDIKTAHPTAIPTGQATFEQAYMVTQEVELSSGGSTTHLYPGAAVSATDAGSAALTGKTEPAYICTSTIQLSKSEFIYLNTKMTYTEKMNYYNRFKDGNDAEKKIAADILKLIEPAYYCTKDGLYGGDYYEAGKNYRGLAAWCSMSEADRQRFTFNYDALDLLIDPNYSGNEGEKWQYDGSTSAEAAANQAGYSKVQPLDYTATYNSDTDLTLTSSVTVKRGETTETTTTITKDDDLTRAAYESIPNEQRHYAPVKSTDGKCYVVNTSFIVGNTPYAVGTTITESVYNNLGDYKPYVTKLEFDSNLTMYYCRESYVVGEHGEGKPVKSIIGTQQGTYAVDETVPVGAVISMTDETVETEESTTTYYGYTNLTNKQKNFVIHGIAPTETSTLYVSRSSDIFDLSTDKIITVIYQYDYEESDVSDNVTPVSERHVVNIHIKFKSGVPSVEDIRAPQIVIPGDFVGLSEPNVTPGAYEVTGGGWELFEKESDAESHINGVEFSPNIDQLYWYQDGYLLAYYAKTYLGKTYSNHVPVSVANYHDLKKVMDDKEHHYYIDKPVKRDSKIYINDYSSSQNGLDLLKGLVDLTYSNADAISTYGALETPANIRGAENLDIIMRTNITHSGSWTPIANNTGECFEGTLHGDGYYIDGLGRSLFANLCGNVYNLGVMGTFTEAGIANTGKGYVENCWVKSSATSGFAEGVRAVFGNPTAGSGVKQIVNCYYPNTNTYKVTTDDDNKHGIARQMSLDAFHDGDVAYNLNGFYLYKRYSDKATTAGMDYQFYTVGSDNTLSAPQTKWYSDNRTICSSGVNGGKYVEDRFADGDFRFANGTVPETADERTYYNTSTKVTSYYPIWPDDYIYFGQMLTFRWNDLRPHEEVPSHIYKSGDRLVTTDWSNRVYRAPAYYGNSTMDVAHFNPHVNLVAYAKQQNAADTNPHPAYPGMTAIDFKGHNDTSYNLGWNGNYFYQPLLDDDGIQSIVNRDETANLLVYAPSATDNQQTYTVLTNYFKEPAFSGYYDSTDPYRRVDIAPTNEIFGHLVQSGLTTTSDHLLVDEEDFNCPISYSMGVGYRMWYQRTPDNFVTITENNKTTGWEGICLPFEAELVTTEDKGEITHFYGSSTTGHEYWLREYKGGAPLASNNKIFEGKFNSMAAGNNTKNYTNTYLWDYYYSYDDNTNSSIDVDKNQEAYQTTYYKTAHSYSDYPYNVVGKPYLVGFPGASYYEFDLSGVWTPSNRYSGTVPNPGSQVITFASKATVSDENKVTIGVSDTELNNGKTSADGYTYVPNYINRKLETDGAGYILADDGGSYVKNEAGATVGAFRPYIVQTSAVSPTRGAEPNDVERVVFSNDYPDRLLPHADPSDKLYGTLDIYGKKGMIVVKSSLRYTVDVSIYTPVGIKLNGFVVKAGETVETPITRDGVYIVCTDDGQYSKKLIIRGKK